MTGLGFDVDDPRLAAAAWSRLVEPGDLTAGTLVRSLGTGTALRWVAAAAGPDAHRARAVQELLERTGDSDLVGHRLDTAVERWSPRLGSLDPRRDLGWLDRLGGVLLLPGQEAWPAGLGDLAGAAPFALWARGEGASDLGAATRRAVALVGARACTDYGTTVAGDLAGGLADRGFTIVSGGAYGIDAAAHRGALAAGGRTLVLLAGGVDRPYPAGNVRLLSAVMSRGGAVLSEVPPGAVPSRNRFLLRNRLIAAVSAATVVVEAAWRSGAISTATRAQELLRPVGAVPGPVTSMASAGCHRLLREYAVCVTDAAEVADLAGVVGADLAVRPDGPATVTDGLGPAARRLYDALPLRSPAGPDALARAAGLSARETLAALGELELGGLAVRESGAWRRAS